MSGDTQKKSEQSSSEPQDKIQELAQQPITDRDAQSVKGGVAPHKLAKK